MMKQMPHQPKVLFFGSGTFRADVNMAIDEAMMQRAEITGNTYIRFYGFKNRTVVLSFNDDEGAAIKLSGLDEVALVRRITAGTPIYIDKGTLCYSITGPVTRNNSTFSNPSEIHSYFGSMIAKAISTIIGPENKVELGKAYSIRVRGKPIAGHSQHVGVHSYLYQGILAIEPWNAERIDRTLQLRPTDIEEIKHLPSMKMFSKMDPDVLRKEFARMLLAATRATKIDEGEAREILNHADTLVPKYKGPEWLHRNDIKLDTDARFCLLYEG